MNTQLTTQEVVQSRIVSDKSYNTVRNGRVASYTGQGVIRKDDTWFWVQGYKSQGDPWTVRRQGRVEIVEISDLAAFIQEKLEEADEGRSPRYRRLRKVFPATVDLIPHPGLEWKKDEDGSIECFDRPLIQALLNNIQLSNSITWEEAMHAAEHEVAYIWENYWDYGCGKSPQANLWGVIPEPSVSLNTPRSSGSTLKDTTWEAILEAARIAAEWDDTVHLFRQVDWIYKSDDEEGYPVFAEDPEINVDCPEEGNWVTVTRTHFILGHGYVEETLARFRCREGGVRIEWE